jgi:hypothetical protein
MGVGMMVACVHSVGVVVEVWGRGGSGGGVDGGGGGGGGVMVMRLAAVMTRFVIARVPMVCRVFENTYLPGPRGLMV